MAEKRQKPCGWEWTGHGLESRGLSYLGDGALAERVSAVKPSWLCVAGSCARVYLRARMLR